MPDVDKHLANSPAEAHSALPAHLDPQKVAEAEAFRADRQREGRAMWLYRHDGRDRHERMRITGGWRDEAERAFGKSHRAELRWLLAQRTAGRVAADRLAKARSASGEEQSSAERTSPPSPACPEPQDSETDSGALKIPHDSKRGRLLDVDEDDDYGPRRATPIYGITVDEEDVRTALDTLGDGVYDDYRAGIGYTKAQAYRIARRRLAQVLAFDGIEARLRWARHEAEHPVPLRPPHVASGGTPGTPTRPPSPPPTPSWNKTLTTPVRRTRAQKKDTRHG